MDSADDKVNLSHGGQRPKLQPTHDRTGCVAVRRSTWIMRFVGTLLLAAAILKTLGLGLDPVARIGLLAAAELQLAVIAFELFLGVWIWREVGRGNPLGPWITAVLTFVGFTIVSAYLVAVGQTSCGCFGRFSPHPIYALIGDVVVIGLLVAGRPTPLWDRSRTSLISATFPAACGIGAAVAVSGVMSALPYLGFRSVPAAIAYFRGERVSVRPNLVHVEQGMPGESRQVTVEVANWTDQPIRLIGGTSSCGCTVLHDLPVTIPAQESRALAVNIALSGGPGIFKRTAGFLIDDGGMTQINFALTGRVLESTDVAGGAP